VTAVNGFYRAPVRPPPATWCRPRPTWTAYLNGNPQLPASPPGRHQPQRSEQPQRAPRLPDRDQSATAARPEVLVHAAERRHADVDHVVRANTLANDYRDQDFVDVPTIAAAGETKFTVGNNQFGTYDIRSKTQEIRLVSPDTGTFKLPGRPVVGQERDRPPLHPRLLRGADRVHANSPSSPTNYYTDIYNTNKAMFGQASWDFAPTWTLVGRPARQTSRNRASTTSATSTPTSWTARPSSRVRWASTSSQSSGNKDRANTGKLSLQKQVTPDWMVYAMTSTGHKGKAYDVTSGLKAVGGVPGRPGNQPHLRDRHQGQPVQQPHVAGGHVATRPTSRATSRTPPSCCRTIRPSTPS
jgi:iron complex outermembrane receptor protein